MSSKKEEERNEKIVRGLMKLPPNRRCINCNSLGPQYVCTNFWTFVCTTCSGIHREFTHRVKSVSMSKFTSQEVEALQKGGNQRARDIYLKDWDLQRQRLPDSSNVERVREFLKSVYVDKRYAGGMLPDKPPRDIQSHRNQEDETRRASSYHSYSQSPPYDYQYEERRYGKQGALTRKPGSDRGRYEGNISSLVYSPGRLSEHMYEDRFANDGTAARVSDYSVSSGGHPFKSGSMSPNFEKEAGSGSPATQASKNISTEDVQRKTIQTFTETKVKDLADGIRHPQRTASSGTFGSFDSNSTSLQSVNSSNLFDVVSEPEQSWGVQQGSSWSFPSLTKSSSVPLPVTSSASTLDLFQSSSAVNLSQLPHTFQGQPIANVDKNSPHISVPKDEGWATFDVPQQTASSQMNQYLTPSELKTGNVDAPGKSNWPSSTGMPWPFSQISDFRGISSSISTPWNEVVQEPQASSNASHPQPWNAFGESSGDLFSENVQPRNQHVAALAPSLFSNQYLDFGVSESSLRDLSREGTQRTDLAGGSSVSSIPSYGGTVPPSYALSSASVMDVQPLATGIKSTNPFDFQFDSEPEPSNLFMDMSSLQTALPNAQLPSSFVGGVTDTWFPQVPVTPYIPTAAQGGMAYIAEKAPNSQLPNVPTQGSVASIGGNPFA